MRDDKRERERERDREKERRALERKGGKERGKREGRGGGGRRGQKKEAPLCVCVRACVCVRGTGSARPPPTRIRSPPLLSPSFSSPPRRQADDDEHGYFPTEDSRRPEACQAGVDEKINNNSVSHCERTGARHQ